jgi:hypothetical protein
MSDTTESAARAQLAIYQRLGASARLSLAFEMSALARQLALARLRGEHPEWSSKRLNRELLRYSLVPAPFPSALE